MKLLKLILIHFLFIAQIYSQNVKPSLIGIVVSDLNASTTWYSELFDLKLVKEMSFPKYDSLKINFLKNDDFQLELMEKKTSFSIKDYVENYSINNKPLLGFSKIAFTVKDIQAFYKKIKAMNAKEILAVTEDKEFNTAYFIIADPDGNALQFIQDL